MLASNCKYQLMVKLKQDLYTTGSVFLLSLLQC